jgi:uncharacterized protein YceH (UPF0502 family)
MSTSSSPETATPPRWRALEAAQRRVLGVLIEKAKTTPAGYPMSVNAIVTGCNQKNNRDPVTAYDEFDVEKALGELVELGVVQEIDWVGRVAKYKHKAYEWLGVRPVELAVLGELLLRGAQAMGELRARAARMEPIEDLAALQAIVDGLLERKLMIELTPPGRGQVVTHNLYTPAELETVRGQHGKGGGSIPAERPARREPVARATEVKVLELAALTGAGKQAATFQGHEHGANVSCFVVHFATGLGPRRHRHPYEETFILLEGEVRLVTDGTSRTVGAGTIVVIPDGTWHEFTVTSEAPVRMVTVHPVARMVTEWADEGANPPA